MNTGIYKISNDEYHASEGLSRSGLWTFKELPQKYWHQYLSGNYESEQSEAMLLGSVVHTLVLEPHLFNDEYVTMPKIDRRTKEGKLAYSELLLFSDGKKLITQDVITKAQSMSSAVSDNDIATQIINDANVEQSIYWEDKKTGILCKARPDIWKSGLVADLKTCNDASYRNFQSEAMRYGYFLQAGMIYEATASVGDTLRTFAFICVEKEEPYTTAVYVLDEYAIEFGRDLFRDTLDKFAECQHKNDWPSHGTQILSIPAYATI